MSERNVPSRPKFSWDMKNAPWTDGRGNQERFFTAVQQWCLFHSKLPDSNSNKIPASLQGMMLQSQLFGRARDICLKMSSDDILAPDGAIKIAKAIHKSDPLAIVNDAFRKFQDLLSVSRGHNELMINFENRFDASLSRLNAVCTDNPLPESIVAFLALAHANIDSSQRMSILSSVVSKTLDESDSSPLHKIKYSDIASLIRACDTPNELATKHDALSANSARTSSRPNFTPTKTKKTLNAAQLKDLKSKSRCRRCKKIGHWASDNKCASNVSSNSSSSDHQSTPNQRSNAHSGSNSSNVLRFGMVNLEPPAGFLPSAQSADDPCVDDGAPYSGLGEVEADKLFANSGMNWRDCLEPIPAHISNRPFWQYGAGEHSSLAKPIIGSIMLQMLTDNNNVIEIRHLIIQGSSQWVIGRNLTSKTNIVHIDGDYILLPNGDHLSMIQGKDSLHSFLPSSKFRAGEKLSALVCLLANSKPLTWTDTVKIVDKVHKHVCGHSNFNDIRTLLERNGLWSDGCDKYLASVLESCSACRAVQMPVGMRTVSLSALSANFNQLVNIDHFFLNDITVCHVMDATSRYSVGQIVDSTSIPLAIETLESRWITEFWPPHALQYDRAFATSEFEKFLDEYGIQKRRIPARRHNKLAIESKHRSIRDIFIRLEVANPQTEKSLLVHRALRISNDLYGNEVLSAHEQAKGYTRPICNHSPVTVPNELVNAQKDLLAKRKLNLILRSKSITEPAINVGDLVEVYIQAGKGKRGHWSQPKTVLEIDYPARTVIVPGSGNKRIHAAFEDTRIALKEDVASSVQNALDDIDSSIDDALNDPANDTMSNQHPSTSALDDDAESDDTNAEFMNPEHNVDNNTPPTQDSENLDSTSENEDIDPADPTSRVSNRELQNLEIDPQWTFRSELDLSTPQMQTRSGSSSQHAHEIELLPKQLLSSHEQTALKEYMRRFGSKEFLLHQAEGLSSWVTQNAYDAEQSKFLQSVRRVHISHVPRNANIIRSHVLYKVKSLDDNSLLMKARIAPHGNEDRERYNLRTDSESCSPLGIRVLQSIAVIKKWFLTKVDILSAFLQSGPAERDVYVVPPRECSDRWFYWLLLTAAYGLVNANVKWQKHCDNTFNRLGLSSVKYIPQLFYLRGSDGLKLVVLKVVDDMLIAGSEEDRKRFLDKLRTVYKVGTIVHTPGSLKFFGSEIVQSAEFEIEFHSDEKLNAIDPYVITRSRRRECDSILTSVESKWFNSINGSLGFIGSMTFPIASFFTSHLQQRRAVPNVQDLALQNNLLKQAKRLGSCIKFGLPSESELPVSLLMFSDAARPNERGQLGFIGGLLLGEFDVNSVIHIVSWRSSLSGRPVKSIGSAEVLAAGSAIDEGKLLAKTYSELLDIAVPLRCAVDSKDLYSSLSTTHVPEDKSIRGDVALIRYEFERKHLDQMVWIPGASNPSDALTKLNSPLTESVHLMLSSSKLPCSFESSEARSSNASMG